MTVRRPDVGVFEFVRVSSLRAAQLIRGCTPRVAAATKAVTTAQREVLAGRVIGFRKDPAAAAPAPIAPVVVEPVR